MHRDSDVLAPAWPNPRRYNHVKLRPQRAQRTRRILIQCCSTSFGGGNVRNAGTYIELYSAFPRVLCASSLVSNVPRVLSAILLSLTFGLAQAAEAPPAAEDPVVEARLVRLASELRCLVCQNQSLADSHADLAVDLRNHVRQQIMAGKSDAQIRAWMTERYGDFVLYRPPVKSTTMLLWVGPFVLLAVAFPGLIFYLRRRTGQLREAPLTEEERARAQALLRSDEPGSAT